MSLAAVLRKGAAAIVAAAFLVNPASAANAQPVRVALARGTVSLPFYVAESEALFKSQGLAVELLPCNSGRDCFRLLVEGKADVATAAELVVVLGSVQTRDAVILATISASSQQLKLVARRSAGIDAPKDFAGKRIGTVSGSSAEYFLYAWLTFHDVRPERAEIVAAAPDRLAQDLVDRKLDAIAVWEPYASTAHRLLDDDAAVLPTPRVYTQYFNTVALRPYLASHEDELRRLLKALTSAQASISAQPAAAARALAQRLGIDEVAARKQMAEHDFRVRLDQSLVNTMSSQRRWASQTKRGAGPTEDSGIEPRVLRSVAPGAVTLVQHP